MAGGIGSRFWPKSRTSLPKQFIDIMGTGQTLIQMTYSRFLKLCPKENILVVTHSSYKHLVKEQLPELSDNQILCEPARRNTAPCIAYANYKIAELNPNATVIVAPSDHLILKEEEFVKAMDVAINQVRCESCLTTISIKPTRPDTGYGYIQFDTEEATSHALLKRVKTFTEKPNLMLAKQSKAKKVIKKKGYWNSGMFIWSLKSIMQAMEIHLPEVDNLFKEGVGKYNTPEEDAFIQECYQVCPNESIDYGVMEKAKNVYTVLSDFGWSDLGTWGSLYTNLQQDDQKNAVLSKNVRLYDCTTNMVSSSDKKLVVIQGLNDYIVVDTDDVLLICKKEDEQQIKQLVNDLKINKVDKYI